MPLCVSFVRSLEPQWLSIFDEIELQRLLSGDADQAVDLADWQAHTVYDDRNDQGASAGHRVCQVGMVVCVRTRKPWQARSVR